MRNRKSVLIIILLTFLTRVQLLWEPYIHSDESFLALSAKIWRQGGIPFIDWIETKPLGVYVFYSLGAWFHTNHTDIHMPLVHFISILWTLLTAWVVARIASHLSPQGTPPKAGFIAALFFVLFSSFWDPTIVAVSIEVVLLLPLCLSILLLYPSSGRLRFTQTFFSGLCVSAAVLCKYQAGILIPIFFVYFWIVLPKIIPGWDFRKALLHSLVFVLGCLPLSILMIGYLKFKGALDGFIFWNFYGNYFYIRDGTAAIDLKRKIITQIVRHLFSTLLLWGLAIDRLIHFLREKAKTLPETSAYESLIWIWFFLSFIPVSIGKRFEDHYFLFLIPPLCVLSAASLTRWSIQRRRKWGWAVLLAVILPTIGFTGTRYFIHSLNQKFDGEDMNSYRPYAAYLKERTKSDDRIFVWGCGPAVYLFADRRPASRFLRTDVLAGRVPGVDPRLDKDFDPQNFIVPKTWEMFFEDMSRHPPAYIMDLAPTGLHDFLFYPMSRYPQIMGFIKENYLQDPDFQKAVVYHRIERR